MPGFGAFVDVLKDVLTDALAFCDMGIREGYGGIECRSLGAWGRFGGGGHLGEWICYCSLGFIYIGRLIL